MKTASPHTDQVDIALSALLGVQALTLFVAIPAAAAHPTSHFLLDVSHLIFAAISVAFLTRHRAIQAALRVGRASLAAISAFGERLSIDLGLSGPTWHEVIALTAFAFNGLVTALVARHVFGARRVTAHRVQGAVLIYLNVASLFAIAFGALETYAPGSIVAVPGGNLPMAPGVRTAALTYFSLSTLTTTGFGDFTPMHPLARSLANLESVFGQLFPATLLARLVALHLAHSRDREHG